LVGGRTNPLRRFVRIPVQHALPVNADEKELIVIEEIYVSLQRAASAQRWRVIKGATAFLREEDGATMVEYGLMVALIAIVCITAVTSIGTNLNSIFSDIAGAL
jgi:pilus assembly protein Flp/PilA